MVKMLRNEKGRFTGKELDPRIKRSIESERETVKNIETMASALRLTPEDLGLRKSLGGDYEITYATVQIFKNAAKDLGPILAAQPAA